VQAAQRGGDDGAGPQLPVATRPGNAAQNVRIEQKAARIEFFVMSTRFMPAGSPPVTRLAMAAKSWR
jgi:hypothetical protein